MKKKNLFKKIFLCFTIAIILGTILCFCIRILFLRTKVLTEEKINSGKIENIVPEIKNETTNSNIVEEKLSANDNNNNNNNNNEVEKYEESVNNIDNLQEDNEVQNDIQEENSNIIEEIEPQAEYIEGYEVIGYIKIPKNNVEAPIFRYANKRTLELSIGVAFGSLNEIGNTTLFGHAYNNMPFEKISTLENGDIIIIKDSTNREVTYQVFDKQIISSQDATYMMRDTNGTREISMQTGAENNNKLIVLAREVINN